MAIIVGSVAVEVVPSTERFWQEFIRRTAPGAKRAGQATGNSMGEAMADAMADQATRMGEKMGHNVGTSMARTMNTELNRVSSDLGTVSEGMGRNLGAGMRRGFEREVRAIGSGIEQPLRIASQRIDKEFAKRRTLTVDVDMQTLLKEPRDFGGAFQRKFRDAIAGMMRDLPDFSGEIFPEGSIEAKIQRIQAELGKLRDQRIDIDINADEAIARMRELQAEFFSILRDTELETKIHVDTSAAEEHLDKFLQGVKDNERQEIILEPKFDRGFLADKLTQDIEKIIKEIPEFKNLGINVDTDPAKRAIEFVRVEMESLRDKRIKLEINDEDAQRKIRELRDGLIAKVVNREIDVTVDVDNAISNLNRLLGESDRTFGQMDRHVDRFGHNANIQTGKFGGIGAAIVSMGAAVIPVMSAATAGVVALGFSGAAAASGIGVLVLAMQGVGSGLKSMLDAEKNAATSAAQLAVRARQNADRLESVRDAEQALSAARANATSQAVNSAQAVTNAERNLALVQRETRDVQADLTRARQDARQAMEDLNAEVLRGALSERQAVIDLERARLALAKSREGEDDALDRAQAQLTHDQAVQRLNDIRRRNKELAAEKTASDRAGVEGSRRVLDAQAAITRHTERVRDAEEAVAAARRRQEDDARQSRAAILNAQRNLVRAQEAMTAQAERMGTSGAAAIDKMREELGELTPPAREFVEQLFFMRGRFKDLQSSAAAGLFPGVTAGIQEILQYFGPLREFVSKVATEMGIGFQHVVDTLQNPTWRAFFTYIGGSATTFMRIWLDIILDIAEGFAGIMLAFAPMAEEFLRWLSDVAFGFSQFHTTNKFAQFMKYVERVTPIVVGVLKDMWEAVEHLVEASAPVGEFVVKAFGKLARAIADIPVPVLAAMIAALTISVGTIKGLSIAVNAFKSVRETATFALGAINLMTGGILAQTAATRTATGAVNANKAAWATHPIGAIVTIIVASLAAITAAFVAAYRESQPLQDAVGRIIAIFKDLGRIIDTGVRVVFQSFGIDVSGMFEALGFILAGIVNVIADFIQRLIAVLLVIGDLVGEVGRFIGALISFDGSSRNSATAAQYLEAAVRGIGAGLIFLKNTMSPILGFMDALFGDAIDAKVLAQDLRIAEDQFYSTARAAEDAYANSLDTVQAAEQRLLDTQRERERAVLAIADAEEAAARRIADTKSQLQGGNIAQQRADLAVKDAEAKVKALAKDPKATERQRLEARLDHQEAVLRLDDLRRRNKQLADDAANDAKRGVQGSHEVVAAKDRVKQIDKDIATASKAYTDAKVQHDKTVRGSLKTVELSVRAVETATKAVNEAGKPAPSIWEHIKTGIQASIVAILESIKAFCDNINEWAKQFGGLIAKGFLLRAPNTNIFASSNSGGGGGGRRAQGGVLPGYTPNRDVHHFYSPTAGDLHLSGGEAILVPELTAVLGSSWVDDANKAARRGGIGGAQKFLGGYASGGVLGAGAAGGMLNSRFRIPMAGKLTSGFGMRWGSLHDGIDIAAPQGTPIVAAWPGTVYLSGPSGGWGNQVVLAHGDYQGKPLFTRYAHMLRTSVAQGQRVNSGQLLGLEGTTGQSTGPHLHFGTYRGAAPNYGTAVNPLSLYGAMAGGWPAVAGELGAGAFGLMDGFNAANASLSKVLAGFKASHGSLLAGVVAGAERARGLVGNWVKSLIPDPIENVINSFSGVVKEGIVGLFSPGVARWAPMMTQALRELGQDPNLLLAGMLRRLKMESGGNPLAINLWDSNARAGMASRGLMQTIPSTFAAHAGKYVGRGIFDPYANIYAGLHYALNRYKDLRRIDPEFPGGLGYRGYDTGGYLPPGLTLAYNGTGQNETIRTAQQEAALQARLGGTTLVRVYIGNEEFNGYIDTRVDRALDDVGNGMIYGTEDH